MPTTNHKNTIDTADLMLDEPDLTDNAREVLRRRYLIKNDDGDPVEKPKDMFWRVASRIAAEEDKYDGPENSESLAHMFYDLMVHGHWMPNSPTLTGAGRDLGMLSACFVLPVSDTLSNSTDGIFDSVKNAALVWQAGGGTGYDFSDLRPDGSRVKSTTGVASGPVSFMEIYNTAVNTMKQGGHRRGAQMAILRVDHPDIMQFVHAKADTSKLTNFNISVAATDEFMERALAGEEYDLIDPRDSSVVGQLDAAQVLEEIVEQAHSTGEPGLFFVDRSNNANPIPHLGDICATNPCGEIPLPPYGVCNLGHVNLAKYITERGIDWDGLSTTVHYGVRFLDNVIDANNYPLPEIRERSDKTRRIGLGVMGWADALINRGIPYESDEALTFADTVAEFVHEEAVKASEKLAEERGVFPAWEGSHYTRPRRNSYVNTVAPTGTTSILAGCSSGIEPNYAFAFLRNQAETQMTEVHPAVYKHLDITDDTPLQEIQEAVSGHPVLQSSHEISPEGHIRMQAVWQQHTEQAISKTINFAKDATVEDVREGYELAYELGCKGVTVYRDGSRPGQVLVTEEDGDTAGTVDLDEWERPDVISGETHRIDSPLGRMYITVNSDANNNPREVFVGVGKAGGSANANAEAVGRLLSTALQWGVPIEELYHQLSGISSERAIGFGDYKVRSGPDAVAQVLHRYVNGNSVRPRKGSGTEIAACPDCSSQLQFSEGCLKCDSCGYSQCG